MNKTSFSIIRMTLVACPLLWACQEETVPGLSGKEGEVKEVQLAFSVSAAQPNTRMSDAFVNGNTNGVLKDLSFVPFRIDGTSVQNTDNPLGEIIHFESNLTQNTIFSNVNVPIGTNAFLVYGVDQQFQGADAKGKLEVDLEHETNAIQIKPVSISPKDSEIYNNVLANTTKLNDYLTLIANTEGWSEAVEMRPARDEFLGLKAGSSMNVLAAVQDLYTLYRTATEGVPLALKKNILTATNADANGVLSYQKGYPTQHPIDYGLPAGSAAISWDAVNNKFINAATTVSPLKVAPSEYYAYPAALWYHTNSRITTSTKHLQELYPNEIPGTGLTEKEWKDCADAIGRNDASAMPGYVSTATQTIMVRERMQYGVARIDLRVNAASNALIDNAGAIINIGSEETFPMTGILVGGQRMVDFSFQQFENASPQFTMYDKNVEGLQLYHVDDINTTKTASTLVLESKKVEESDLTDSPFTFALEFQNNSGNDFVGVDRKIIAPGCKFYLIGSITPTTDDKGKPVFEQDKITKIDVTVNSLVNAYYIIPDLRDPQLRVGVTVEDWILSTPSGPIVM